jgi:hypothetical protein
MEIVCGGVVYVASLSDGVLGAVLGAALGSGITLLGVWRQNVNARAQMREQLGHEKTQAAETRAHEQTQQRTEHELRIKQEVFLEAAAWSSAVTTYIGQYPKLDAEPQIRGDHSAAPARLELVAGTETMERFIAVTRSYVEFISTFGIRQRELHGRHKKLMELGAVIERKLAEGASDFPDNDFEKDVSDHKQLLTSHFPEVRQFQDEVLAAIPKIARTACLFQLAMSRELGFTPDEAARIALVDAQSADAIAEIKAMVERENRKLGFDEL